MADRRAPRSDAAWLRPTLAVLWLVWFAFVPGGMIVVGATKAMGLARWWWVSTVSLSVAAWAHWLARRSSPVGRFHLGIAIGMTLGAMADSYGALPRAWRFAETLTAIIPLFALGHVAYISAGWGYAHQLGLRNRIVSFASLTVWLLIGAAIWIAIVPGAEVGAYYWPTLGYTLLLSATTGTMSALALQRRQFLFMAIGALLFLISDAALATNQFHNLSAHAHLVLSAVVWFTYGTGQMLIVYGAAFTDREG